MTRKIERMERALRGCAQAGVPDTVDLWPGLRERTMAKRRRGPSRLRFAPRTRAGWAFAVLAALCVMTGAGYAASGLVFARFQEELPGADAREVGTEIGQERIIDEAKVTLEWAYADEEFVVLGYSIKDLKDDRRNAGHRVQLEPIFVDEYGVEAGRGPDQRATLTDEGGRELGMIDGTFEVAGPSDSLEVLRMPKSNSAVFEVPEDLEPGRNHRFHLEIPLEEMPTEFPSMEEGEQGVKLEPRPPIGPFVFDFEVPVRPAPAIETDQKVVANGVEITLDRVVNSPARPQAVICFEPPDDKYEWYPMVEAVPADREVIESQPLGNNCWSAALYDRIKGRSSITVMYLDGAPSQEISDGPEGMQPKMLQGPWKFDFEVPER